MFPPAPADPAPTCADLRPGVLTTGRLTADGPLLRDEHGRAVIAGFERDTLAPAVERIGAAIQEEAPFALIFAGRANTGDLDAARSPEGGLRAARPIVITIRRAALDTRDSGGMLEACHDGDQGRVV